MPTAYILINCILGKEEEIIQQISQLKQVKEGKQELMIKFQKRQWKTGRRNN